MFKTDPKLNSTLCMMQNIRNVAQDYNRLLEENDMLRLELAMVNAMNGYLLFKSEAHNVRYEILCDIVQQNNLGRMTGAGPHYPDWASECNKRLVSKGYPEFDFS